MKKQKAPAVAGMIRKVGREIFCEDKVQELEFLIVKREGGGRAGLQEQSEQTLVTPRMGSPTTVLALEGSSILILGGNVLLLPQ